MISISPKNHVSQLGDSLGEVEVLERMDEIASFANSGGSNQDVDIARCPGGDWVRSQTFPGCNWGRTEAPSVRRRWGAKSSLGSFGRRKSAGGGNLDLTHIATPVCSIGIPRKYTQYKYSKN